MKEGLYITQMEATNFMGVKHQVIDFGNGNVYLIGGNGRGKSSLINALLSPLNSKYIPQKPIHEGEERGVITLKIEGNRAGEFEQYEIQCVFTPSNRNGKITLTRNGEKVKGSEKTVINNIFGKIGFDLTEFFNASEREQVQMLKELSGCGEKLDEIDHQRLEKEAERKIIKKALDDAKTVNSRANRPFTDEDVDRYKTPIPEEEVKKMENELKGVEEKVQKYNDNIRKIESIKQTVGQNETLIRISKSEIDEIDQQILDLEAKRKEKDDGIKALKKANAEYQEKLDKAAPWLEKNPNPPSSKEITDRMSQVREHNRMNGIITEYMHRQKDILGKQGQYEELEEQIKGLLKQKIDVIASSQLPVEGLLWGDDGVTLGGIPITQVNTQKKIDLAKEIAIALNPTLKLVIIKEASLFDTEHLKATTEDLDKRGYFFVAEIVDPAGGELEIKYEERSPE